MPCMQKFQTFCLQASCHMMIFILLGAIGFVMWQLLEKYNNSTETDDNKTVITSLVITVIMNFIPLVFTWIVK